MQHQVEEKRHRAAQLPGGHWGSQAGQVGRFPWLSFLGFSGTTQLPTAQLQEDPLGPR